MGLSNTSPVLGCGIRCGEHPSPTTIHLFCMLHNSTTKLLPGNNTYQFFSHFTDADNIKSIRKDIAISCQRPACNSDYNIKHLRWPVLSCKRTKRRDSILQCQALRLLPLRWLPTLSQLPNNLQYM